MLLTARVCFTYCIILWSKFPISSGACRCVCLSQARGTLYKNKQQLSICKKHFKQSTSPGQSHSHSHMNRSDH